MPPKACAAMQNFVVELPLHQPEPVSLRFVCDVLHGRKQLQLIWRVRQAPRWKKSQTRRNLPRLGESNGKRNTVRCFFLYSPLHKNVTGLNFTELKINLLPSNGMERTFEAARCTRAHKQRTRFLHFVLPRLALDNINVLKEVATNIQDVHGLLVDFGVGKPKTCLSTPSDKGICMAGPNLSVCCQTPPPKTALRAL